MDSLTIAIIVSIAVLVATVLFFVFTNPIEPTIQRYDPNDCIVLPDDFGELKTRFVCHINEENDLVSLVPTSTGGTIECPANCEVVQDKCIYPLSDEEITRELRKGPQGLTHGEQMFVMNIVNSDPRVQNILGDRQRVANCCTYMSDYGQTPTKHTLGVTFNMKDKDEVVEVAIDLQTLQVSHIESHEPRWYGQSGVPSNQEDIQNSDVAPRPDLFLQKPLTIEGLNEIQYVDKKIEFTVNFNEIGYDCGYPQLRIEDGSHQQIWGSGIVLVVCDPDLTESHIEREWMISDSPLGTPIIKKPGFYTLFATYGNNTVQKDFWVNPQISTVTISENNLEYGSYDPTTIKVKIDYNNTVRWVNQGKTTSKIEADNVADLNFFEATNFDVYGNSFLAPGQSFEFTFNQEGVFGYHGQPWQRGTVIVLPPDDVTIQLQIQPPDSPEDKNYSLKVAARKGYFVSWYNIDNKTHAITSKADNGQTFDSGPIHPRNTVFTLDTSSMESGYYQYYDKLNPEFSDTIRIIDPAKFDDDKLIEDTKNLKEVQEFLAKYPEAFSHVDHDYYDMVSYGIIKKTTDRYRSIWLRVIFDESGNIQRTLIDCGFGGITLEAPNALDYLKTEKCLSGFLR